MLNYKDFLPTDNKKELGKPEREIIKEENHLSLRDNFSFTNSNIKNHKINKYAPDYFPSSNNSIDNNNAVNNNSENTNTATEKEANLIK